MWSTIAVTALTLCTAIGWQAAPQSAKAQEPTLEYPTLEPFFGSKMQQMLFGELDKLDLEDLAKQLGQLGEANRHAKNVAEKNGTKPTGPSAALEPQLAQADSSVAKLLPIVMAKLRPLWEAKAWTAEQVQLASTAATIVSRMSDGPKLTFESGKDGANRAELEKLVRWFDVQMAKPALYAAMIFTMDDGPFAGLPFEAPGVLTTDRVIELDEHLELRLAKSGRPKEPWVLQGVRDGVLVWSRVISAAPNESVSDVRFVEAPPAALGEYGWRVSMLASWSYGTEHAPLYIDAKGNFLFYFLSW